MKRKLLTAVVGPALVLIAAPSFAQPPTRTADTRSSEQDYSYEFSDDDVLGVGPDGYGLVIREGHRRVRTLLIRPRAQFISEMLKSVETL